MAIQGIINIDDPVSRAKLINAIRLLEGNHRVDIVKHRPRRSDRQNRYMWPCVVHPFAEFLRAQGEPYTDEQAHEILKAKFLRVTVMNKETGELIGERVRSTTELDTQEFFHYVEQCRDWLADMFDIETPDPTPFHAEEKAEA